MVEPILASGNTWWAPTNSAVTRASITEIEIKDSYTPDASVTVTDSWDASAAKDGSVMCYVIGAKLIIAGNGSGYVYLNTNSAYAFGDFPTYMGGNGASFGKVTSFLGLEFLNLSRCTSIAYIFAFMSKVASLNVSSWDVSNIENMSGIFYSCAKISALNLSNWNTRNAKHMANMFESCRSLASLDISNFNTSNCLSLPSFFDCELLQNINLSHFVTDKITSFRNLFYNCQAMTKIDISSWDMSHATVTARMFEECTNLEEILLPTSFNFSGVTNSGTMFQNCKKLKNIDVSKWDTSVCTNMSFMFYGCSSLGEIDVSNWNVSKVTNFDHFAAHANLKRKGIENWKPISATNMNALFHNCAEEELDLSGWDVSKNQFFCQMFENSPNLKRIKGLDRWNTSAGLGFDGMFERCYKLEEVDLSSFNTTKAKNNVSGSTNGHKTATLQNMFLSCNNLKKVKLGPNFSINGDGTNTTAGNKLILPTPSTDYITGADGNWYAFNGDPYAPNAIQDKTAETYFASFPLCQNEDVIVKNGSLIDVAKAIKEKNGATDKYTPAQFGAAIRAL